MKYSSLLKYLLIAFVSYLSVLMGYQNKVVVEMQPVSQAQASDTIGQETKRDMSAIDIDEEEAIRKVEAANTPDLSAQSGVRNVEAVTLTWTKKSLACAFVWYVRIPD
jgi:hypothetical protein